MTFLFLLSHFLFLAFLIPCAKSNNDRSISLEDGILPVNSLEPETLLHYSGIDSKFADARWLEESRQRSRLLVQENTLSGNPEWWRPYLQGDDQDAVAHNEELDRQALSLEGFSTIFSVQPGHRISFKVDFAAPLKSNAADMYTFSLYIYRLGYYGGAGARRVAVLTLNVSADRYIHLRHSFMASEAVAYTHTQPECLFDNRTVDCSNWTEGASWEVPESSLSGVYLGVPCAQPKTDDLQVLKGQYIPFVVAVPKGEGRAVLVKTSDLTWVAYNKYGGWNLYEPPNASISAKNRMEDREYRFLGRSTIASYDRPWHNRLSFPRGQRHNFLLHTEYPLIYWLERLGYDVGYASCHDFERMFFLSSTQQVDKSALTLFRAFVSSGHDEYWTARMRSVWRAARDAGVHLAFLSGNEMFWRVSWAKATVDGEPRKMTCRKESLAGSVALQSGEEWTGTFMDPHQPNFGEILDATPQSELTGQLYLVNAYRNDALEVPHEYADLRFWRHAPLGRISEHNSSTRESYFTAPGLLGYEWDVTFHDRFRPSGLIALSRTTVNVRKQLLQDFGAAYSGSGLVRHSLSLYRHQHSGALVFATGTCQWSWALAPLHDYSWDMAHVPTDANVQQATLNVFADMSVLPWQPHGVHRTTDLPARWALHYRPDTLRAVPSSKTGLLELVAAFPSPDTARPSSSILWPLRSSQLKQRTGTLLTQTIFARIRGTAFDRGGGVVAAVEVSADGGHTWGLARGRSHWHFTIALHFADIPQNVSAMLPNRSVWGADASTGVNDANQQRTLFLGLRDADRGGSLIFPEYPPAPAAGRRMYITYHSGQLRYNVDVCLPRNGSALEDWVDIVPLCSRATDDSGWTEGDGPPLTSRHALHVSCRTIKLLRSGC